MFTDCVAKNRGAVVAPWREFRTEGNSYFLFSLVVGLALFVFAVLLSVPVILLLVKSRYYFFIHRDQLNIYLISAIVAWGWRKSAPAHNARRFALRRSAGAAFPRLARC